LKPFILYYVVLFAVVGLIDDALVRLSEKKECHRMATVAQSDSDFFPSSFANIYKSQENRLITEDSNKV